MDKLGDTFGTVVYNFKSITPSDVLDIIIVAFVVYEVIIFVRKTRAGQIAQGALFLLFT